MLRKIAIVGANGFVGRQLVSRLVETGAEAVGVVRSAEGVDIVRQLGGRPVCVRDLTDESTGSLVPELDGCDGLVYTASVSTGAGVSDRTNPSGLLNVIAACQSAGVSRLAFLSGLGIAHYGMNPHCTNPYFLAKMAGEVALFRSSLRVTVFRPSYIFGVGDEFLSPLIGRVASMDAIEIPGEGRYRLQPVSVRDTARAILGSFAEGNPEPRVVDLVGPEIVSYRGLVEKVAALGGRHIRLRERPVEEALAQARSSSYFGLRAHDLACLLCDEVSDASAAEALAGGPLESLDAMIESTMRALRPDGQNA